VPAPVSQPRRPVGCTDDVGEQYSCEHAVGLGAMTDAGEELLDLIENEIGITEIRDVIRPRQLDQLGGGSASVACSILVGAVRRPGRTGSSSAVRASFTKCRQNSVRAASSGLKRLDGSRPASTASVAQRLAALPKACRCDTPSTRPVSAEVCAAVATNEYGQGRPAYIARLPKRGKSRAFDPQMGGGPRAAAGCWSRTAAGSRRPPDGEEPAAPETGDVSSSTGGGAVARLLYAVPASRRKSEVPPLMHVLPLRATSTSAVASRRATARSS
jgi:hypothetical protein